MELDELAAKAADELREAGREARFSVRSPAGRPRRLWPALAAAAVLLLLGSTLLWMTRWDEPGSGDIASGSTTSVAVTSTQVSTTVAVSTTVVAVKTPAGSVSELVAALYAALDSYDDAAFRALSTDFARHGVYVYDGTGHGEITTNFAVANYQLASSGIQSIEIMGEPLVSGEAVAIPVRYHYPEEDYLGYDVIIAEQQTGGGLLISGGVTFLADPDLAADPTALTVIAADLAAHNAGDLDAALATMHDDIAFWDRFEAVDPTGFHTGEGFNTWLAETFWFDVEISADPTTSGPFIAVPVRLFEGDESGGWGISIYLIRDGKTAFYGYAM